MARTKITIAAETTAPAAPAADAAMCRGSPSVHSSSRPEAACAHANGNGVSTSALRSDTPEPGRSTAA